MLNTPMLEAIPTLKKIIMIQKAGCFIRIPRFVKLGGSPLKSPPRPKRRNNNPKRIDEAPMEAKTPCHEHILSSSSDIKGAAIYAMAGASSCTAIALPQLPALIEEVIVVIPEGRYAPATRPRRTNPR